MLVGSCAFPNLSSASVVYCNCSTANYCEPHSYCNKRYSDLGSLFLRLQHMGSRHSYHRKTLRDHFLNSLGRLHDSHLRRHGPQGCQQLMRTGHLVSISDKQFRSQRFQIFSPDIARSSAIRRTRRMRWEAIYLCSRRCLRSRLPALLDPM
ncbi:hypothetical protein OH76DRAFT_297095 [Lentinus brumalis]|uniref:Uncharacterized protein n=1 Tax=Lentinus brumalis TaxID=2498619 RepID=A0A371DG67_9APHY|nr:hypothetical protein OH76DRAFT_297095 [Polyporus brumalis]